MNPTTEQTRESHRAEYLKWQKIVNQLWINAAPSADIKAAQETCDYHYLRSTFSRQYQDVR